MTNRYLVFTAGAKIDMEMTPAGKALYGSYLPNDPRRTLPIVAQRDKDYDASLGTPTLMDEDTNRWTLSGWTLYGSPAAGRMLTATYTYFNPPPSGSVVGIR